MPPNIEKTITIHEEAKVKATKAEILKAWAPIVSAITALVTAVIVALLSAPSSKLDGIAERLDEKVIPKLEQTIESLQVKVAKLEVYQVVFEKEIEDLKSNTKSVGPPEPIAVKVSAAKAKAPKSEKFELPRVQMEQRVLPMEMAAEK